MIIIKGRESADQANSQALRLSHLEPTPQSDPPTTTGGLD
jgi:hypothetical protein